MRRANQRQRGDALVEFTLVGIPLIFALISIFEISRGMWIYHSLAYAVTEGTRYAIVHGENCTIQPNSCQTTIAGIAGVIQYAGVGLLSDQLSLTFTSKAGSVGPCLLKDCLIQAAYTSTWPPANANLPGMDVTISAKYPFSSAIAMFWPGTGPGLVFPTVNLPATATERIQF
ncbi:MAG TPA: TadE family protein [Bryobacteraceae bacterium]|nr:TadE family protein [Bryobacteraceae bacterium]